MSFSRSISELQTFDQGKTKGTTVNKKCYISSIDLCKKKTTSEISGPVCIITSWPYKHVPVYFTIQIISFGGQLSGINSHC